ncbi:MAG: 50S ribosomal protein L5 [Candidatus Omnitrophota bacterium]
MKQAQTEKPRMAVLYETEAIPAMIKAFGYKNAMQVPRLQKVVLNMGVKEGREDTKIVDQLADEMALIAGQKPIITKAKKAISAFKLRKGNPIGVKVTLRRAMMYEFLDRFFNIAMPRIRDFRGAPTTSFDGHGNYTMGIQEQMIFPEIEFDKVKKIQGMDITIVTSAKTDAEAKKLLELLGFPFQKK